IFIVAYRAKAPIAVNDTSMPPEASTIMTPTAKMPVTRALRHRSTRLAAEKNAGLRTDTPAAKTIATTRTTPWGDPSTRVTVDLIEHAPGLLRHRAVPRRSRRRRRTP